MIIQCDACQTRFKLPDEKLKPQGVKVRCTRCETIFRVPAPPQPPKKAVSAPDEVSSGTQSAGGHFDSADIDRDKTGRQPSADRDDFDFDEFNMEDLGSTAGTENVAATSAEKTAATGPNEVREFDSELPDFNLPEDFSFDDSPTGPEPLADFSPEELSLETRQTEPRTDPDESPAATTDFSAADLETPPAEDFSFDPEKELSIGGDLGETFNLDDDLGALPELGERPEAKPEEFGGGIDDEFSFSAAEPEATGDQVESSPTGPVEFAFDDVPADSELDVELDSEQTKTGDFIFEQEPTTLPESSTPPKKSSTPVKQATTPTTPPRSTKNRQRGTARIKKRKKNRHTGLVLMLLLTALLAGGYAYLAQIKGTWDPHVLLRHLQLLTGTSAPEDPTAKIELLNMRSTFISNQNAGQLFAISGEARNGYDHTRSAIAVKGVIYDAKGKPVMQQTVFCGNPLDEAALRTLPFAKIKETMNNQFGDSLSNLDVAPGKTVPFTIVFRNLPNEVTEFNVEVADSRPGTR